MLFTNLFTPWMEQGKKNREIVWRITNFISINFLTKNLNLKKLEKSIFHEHIFHRTGVDRVTTINLRPLSTSQLYSLNQITRSSVFVSSTSFPTPITFIISKLSNSWLFSALPQLSCSHTPSFLLVKHFLQTLWPQLISNTGLWSV